MRVAEGSLIKTALNTVMSRCPYFHSQGYTKPREYIVTEWPLQKTCGEFWSLVYDHECSAIVVLCQPPPNSVRSKFPYLKPRSILKIPFRKTATISFLLARGSSLEEVRPGVHDRPHLAQSLRQHQIMDLPHQQEGDLADGTDGRCEGSAQNGAALSADMLAHGSQGTASEALSLQG